MVDARFRQSVLLHLKLCSFFLIFLPVAWLLPCRIGVVQNVKVVVPHELLHVRLLLFPCDEAHFPCAFSFIEFGDRVDRVTQTFERVLDWERCLQSEGTEGDHDEDKRPRKHQVAAPALTPPL